MLKWNPICHVVVNVVANFKALEPKFSFKTCIAVLPRYRLYMYKYIVYMYLKS